MGEPIQNICSQLTNLIPRHSLIRDLLSPGRNYWVQGKVWAVTLVVDEFINWLINIRASPWKVFGEIEKSRTSVTLLLAFSVQRGDRKSWTWAKVVCLPCSGQGEEVLHHHGWSLHHPTPPCCLAFLQLLFSPEFGIQSRNRHDKHYFSFPWRQGPAIEPGLHAWNDKTGWPSFPPSYKNKISLFGSCHSQGEKCKSSCYLYGYFKEEQIRTIFENTDNATEPVSEIRHKSLYPKGSSSAVNPFCFCLRSSWGEGSYPLREGPTIQLLIDSNYFLNSSCTISSLILFQPLWTFLFLEQTRFP